MLLAYIDTGILTDGVEINELATAVKKMGGDRYEAERKMQRRTIFPSKHLPHADAMQKEYINIMGVKAIYEEMYTSGKKVMKL